MAAGMIAQSQASTPTVVFARLGAIRKRDVFRVVSLREEDQDLIGIANVRQCFQVDAAAPALALRAACDQSARATPDSRSATLLRSLGRAPVQVPARDETQHAAKPFEADVFLMNQVAHDPDSI